MSKKKNSKVLIEEVFSVGINSNTDQMCACCVILRTAGMNVETRNALHAAMKKVLLDAAARFDQAMTEDLAAATGATK